MPIQVGPLPTQVVPGVAVIGLSTSEVTRTLGRLITLELIIGAAAVVVAFGATTWGVRFSLRRLHEVTDTAQEVAAELSPEGAGLDRRVTVGEEGTEVGRLAESMNTLLAAVETQFAARLESEQRMRQFLADASHELRTPLTSIQGFAELYRLGGEAQHVDQPTIFRRIEEESARMKGLVEDLLLLARLDQTRPVRRVPVDLAVLAADACSDAVAAAPDRPVSLWAPDPVVVSGDPDHLRQAIANLVTNAVKHTPDGSPIEVAATLEGGAAVLSVRDHGPGLDDDALEHAFDRFWQADAARVGKGAGLGLSIVAAIAAEHGGSASVRNADDGGAVFTIHLPMTVDGTSDGSPEAS